MGFLDIFKRNKKQEKKAEKKEETQTTDVGSDQKEDPEIMGIIPQKYKTGNEK